MRWTQAGRLIAQPGVLACLLLSMQAGLLAWSAARQAPTVDEPMHIAAGVRIYRDGLFDLDRGNPPLVKLLSAWPVVLAGADVDWGSAPNSFAVANDFLRVNGPRSFELTTCARWGLIPVCLAAGWVSYLWASELFGMWGGVLTLALWTWCPFVLANGELATGDMTATAAAVTACYTFRRWLWQPSLTWCLAAGVSLGLAASAKYACVVLFPLFVGVWIVRELPRLVRPRRWPLRSALQFGVVLLLAVDVINCGYLGSGTLTPLKEYHIGRRLMTRLAGPPSAPGAPGLRTWLGALPVPLPWDYVKGVDEVHAVLTRGHSIYYRGEWLPQAPWTYYLYGLGVKLPLGTLLVLTAAAAGVLLQGRRAMAGLHEEAYLLACGVSLFTFIATVTSIKYLRYMLPVTPLLLIWCGRAALLTGGSGRVLRGLAAAGAAGAAAATIGVYPHCGSYFNWLGGGTMRGYRQFIESSYDWGQDLLYLRRWLDRHPEAQGLTLAYFGRIDPRQCGIEFDLPPRQAGPGSGLRPYEDGGPQPGWHAVSVSLQQGFTWHDVPDGAGGYEVVRRGELAYFQKFTPVARAGYSILIFHITPDDAERVRAELGLGGTLRTSDPPDARGAPLQR